MPTLRERGGYRQFFDRLPQAAENVLRGAAKAGARVIADEVEARAPAAEVRDAVAIKSKRSGDRIEVKVYIKGQWANSLGIWAEYGTTPHFISVDDSQRQGRSVNRINRLAKQEGGSHSLVIGGQFVGTTVLHPGARAEPFMRVSLDLKERDAFAEARRYLDARVGPSGIAAAAEEGDDA